MIFDVSTRSLIVEHEQRVVWAACRRLNTKTSSLLCYNSTLEQLMTEHRMDKRLNNIIDGIVNDKPTAAQQAKMNALDNQFVELQRHADCKCRSILKPELQFSGPVKLWHQRIQAYQALVRWKKGNARNNSNIMRTALRQGIANPRQMTLQQMEEGTAGAKARKRTYRVTHPELRQGHL